MQCKVYIFLIVDACTVMDVEFCINIRVLTNSQACYYLLTLFSFASMEILIITEPAFAVIRLTLACFSMYPHSEIYYRRD